MCRPGKRAGATAGGAAGIDATRDTRTGARGHHSATASTRATVSAAAIDPPATENEAVARTVIASSALSSPSTEEIRMANEGEFLLGKRATIIAVDFDKPDEESVQAH
jgi:hypothetical protein